MGKIVSERYSVWLFRLSVVVGMLGLILSAPASAVGLFRNAGYIFLTRAILDSSGIELYSGREFFEYALTLQPAEQRSTLGRARSAILVQNANVLEEYWRSTSPADLDRAFVWRFLTQRAHGWLANNRVEAARWAYEQLLSLDPTDQVGYTGLGDVAFSTGQFSEAVGYFRQLEKNVPAAKNTALQRQGQTLRVMGQFHEAVVLFEQILVQQPSLEEKLTAFYELGLTYEASNQLDRAIWAFSQVIDHDPEGSIGWFAGVSANHRGEIALRHNLSEEAVTDYELAARLFRRLYPQYSLSSQKIADRLRQEMQKTQP